MDNESDIKGVLSEVRRIAVLGLSPKEERKSNEIARFLIDADLEIIPVNPGYDEILGRPSYPDLKSIPGKVDLAVVFRAPRFTGEVLEGAKASGVTKVWFQPGAFDEELLESELVDGLDVYYGD